MSGKTTDHLDKIIASFPPLRLPAFEKPTLDEIEQRRQAFVRAQQIREAIRNESGSLDIATGELKHLAREEIDKG